MERVQDFIDAIRTLNYLKENDVEMPLRIASQNIFNNSKRLENIYVAMDILLSTDLMIPTRPTSEIWQGLGLPKEEQPIRLAGYVEVVRERVTSLLDSPYGCFSASTIQAIKSNPEFVLSIENLTTFHNEARKYQDKPVLLIYSAGMPTPSWCAMYQRILSGLPCSIPVYHWGDIDEGGFRIAANISEKAISTGHILKPWSGMNPALIPLSLRREAPKSILDAMSKFAKKADWHELAESVLLYGFVCEQESIES